MGEEGTEMEVGTGTERKGRGVAAELEVLGDEDR